MSASRGLVFAGQGAQRHGMGAAWQAVEAWPSVVEEVSDSAGVDVASLLLVADDEMLRRTDRAQLATFALEMIQLTHVRAADPSPPTACAGHSLGEYAALVAAGVLELGQAAVLVAARGRAMDAAGRARPGTMVAMIGEAALAVADVVEAEGAARGVWVANRNAPHQVVVAGEHAGVDWAVEVAAGRGATALPLRVSGAFHTPLMAPASQALRVALAATRFAPGEVPVVANVDGLAHRGGRGWRARLERGLTSPVRWSDSVATLADLGCSELVELGPGRTLSALARRIEPSLPCAPVRAPEAIPG